MKKYIILGVVTIILFAGTLLIPDIVEDNLPKTSVVQMKEIDYVKYVSSQGEIAQRNQKFLVTDFPLIVDEVKISNGESVKKGQTILTVNKEETARKAASLSSYSSIANLPSDMAGISYEDIIKKLPSQIVSTVDGKIDTVSAQDGQMLEQGAVIASLVSTGDLVANISIPENKISDIALGQKVIITGSGFGDKEYNGTIRSISSTAKKSYVGTSQETVVQVVASIDDCDDKVKAGYTIEAKIVIQDQRKINIVPYETVMQDDTGDEFVYVLKDGTALRKNIETGLELSEGVQVVSGVDDTEPIIATPSKIKENGSKVIILD